MKNKQKQINMQSKRKNIKQFLILIVFMCMVASSCTTDPYYSTLEKEYDAVLHNDIIGEWKLVRKSIHSTTEYSDDVVDCNIKFTKIENSICGKYTSNIFPDTLYYVVTRQTDIFFYYSLENIDVKNTLRGNCDYWGGVMPYYPNDTLRLSFAVGTGWFNDKSKYTYYYFIKMED